PASLLNDGETVEILEREAALNPGHARFAMPEAPASDEDIEQFKRTVLAKLTLFVGKNPSNATDRDWFVATTLSLRDRVIHRWLEVDREHTARGDKSVYYLSLEFLIGRLLNDVACNL